MPTKPKKPTAMRDDRNVPPVPFSALLPSGIVTKYDSRDEWLKARFGRIGGSSLPCLYQYGYKKSLLEFWDEKAGNYVPPPQRDSGAMRRGRRLEVPILEELADVTGWEVQPWPQNWVLDHPTVERFGVTLDGLAMPKQENFPFPLEKNEIIVCSIKTANEFARARWPKNDEGGFMMLPPHQIQLQAEMEITGLRYGVLVVQVGFDFDDMIWIPVARDEEFAEIMRDDVTRFWESIENGERPDVDGSDATYDYLRRVYKTEDGTACELPGDADLWLAEWEEGRALRKAGEAKETAAKSKIMAAMENATFARTPHGIGLSYKEQSRTTIDGAKLRANYPEAAEECEKTSFFRVLREVKSLPAEALAMLD